MSLFSESPGAAPRFWRRWDNFATEASEIFLDPHFLHTWGQWCIYHWATRAMPTFELRNNLAYGKKCNQNAPFSGKISNIFCGGGIPPPRPYPHWGGEYLWPDPSSLGASPRLPPNFSPISIITLDYDAVWEIESISQTASQSSVMIEIGEKFGGGIESPAIVSRRRPYGTRLEVGPVNI